MTAGLLREFSILSRDVYGAVKPALEERFIAAFFQSGDRDPVLVFSFKSSLSNESEYSSRLLVTFSGGYSVHIGKPKCTGLGAQFFSGLKFEKMVAERVSSPRIIGSPHPLIGSGQEFSVQWRGFVQMPQGSCSMHLQQDATQDRVRMWINSELVIDQWTSLASFRATSREFLVSSETDEFRHLKIDYSHPYGQPSLILKWSTNDTYISDVPDDKLCLDVAHVQDSPFRVLVVPAAPSILEGRGDGLSMGWVGEMSTFSVVLKDQYGNLRNQGNEDIIVTLATQTSVGEIHTHPDTSISRRAGASQTITYRAPTLEGYHYMFVFVANPGGISSTYYSDLNMSFPIAHATARTIDFSGASRAASLPRDLNFSLSVRWSGFVRPSLVGTYTFFASVTETDERVKLWIDNRLLVTQWSSLKSLELEGTAMLAIAGAYYEVIMEYKHGSKINYGATLKWSSESNIFEELPTW